MVLSWNKNSNKGCCKFMDHFTLTDFKMHKTPEGRLLVLIRGTPNYKPILAHAFPNLRMSHPFEDKYSRYEWGTYIDTRIADESIYTQIEMLLNLLRTHVYIQDDLTETFALDYHTQLSLGGYPRTEIGELVYQAKPYNRPQNSTNIENAKKLSQFFIEFIQTHPSYYRAELILATPPSNATKLFNLPNYLVSIISDKLGIPNGQNIIQKIKKTKPMKDCLTPQEKIENVRDAFQVLNPDLIMRKNIIVVDDIYQSGFTLNEISRVLFEAGASSVLGLVATKTGRDM